MYTEKNAPPTFPKNVKKILLQFIFQLLHSNRINRLSSLVFKSTDTKFSCLVITK